jgi:hypothetical protein
MVDKIGFIKNPLTIIAIFAGIAEISGTIVLPFISDGNQSTYIWFLMWFPSALIVLFFATLNFNHKVLYAPSDYTNEENFFRSLQTATSEERAAKLREEVREIEEESIPDTSEKAASTIPPEQVMKGPRYSVKARYLLAEELILNKLSKELGVEIQRNVRMQSDPPYVFDGLAMSEHKAIAIEIKYFQESRLADRRAQVAINTVHGIAKQLPDSLRSRFTLLLAVAFETITPQEADQFTRKVSDRTGHISFPVQIRIFNLKELEDGIAI